MKNKLQFMLLAAVLFFAQSCVQDELMSPSDPQDSLLNNSYANDSKSENIDEIIIRFDFEYSESKKTTLREMYAEEFNFDLNYFETCPWDPKLELWSTSKNSMSDYIDIEDLITKMKTAEFDEGDLEEDENLWLAVSSHEGFVPGSSTAMADHVTNLNGIKIALIDSGLDYDEFSGDFLYDSSGDGVGNQDVSGWDFVNNDNDIRDDHGHGTNLVKIINQELQNVGSKPQFLMLKAFDENGSGNLFNVLKALAYVKVHPDIDVLNASFGWYGDLSNFTILNQYLDEISQKTLIICSAGNNGLNTDLKQHAHFPSCSPNSEIISVGGYEEAEGGVVIVNNKVFKIYRAEDSNYGKMQVDLAAPFSDYTVQYSDGSKHDLAGTSYSAAYTTARAAMLFSQWQTPKAVRTALLKYECYVSPVVSQEFNQGHILIKE